jgi:hypothetical protein
MEFIFESLIPRARSMMFPKHAGCWYVPINVIKRGNSVSNDEEDIIDFIEIDKGVTVAFSDVTKAKLACINEKWPGLLELGPTKWKSFLIQEDARPKTIIKNPTNLSSRSAAKSIFSVSKRTTYLFVGLLLLVLVWFALNDRFIGPISLLLLLVGKLISPLLQICFSFTMFISTLLFLDATYCISSILTFTISFTAIEMYNIFDDDIFVLNIDHISLREMADNK